MKLSVIIIIYNMDREIRRAVQSLSRQYQQGVEDLDYEVLIFDNGSPTPPDADWIASLPPEFHYEFLEDAHPSPARAINYGVEKSKGDVVSIMIDGAHVVTPGTLSMAMKAFKIFDEPVVATRYFFMGPKLQNESVLEGYCQDVEDKLFERINWPEDGYRLFEVGVPLKGDVKRITWFDKILESNCLFMRKSLFDDIGGADLRFDIAGGGFLNIDMYRVACEHEGVTPVFLIGEGSFHQFHGGTTTNVDPEEREKRVAVYMEQYQKIRGGKLTPTTKNVHFIGHLPTQDSKIHRLLLPYNKV